jgi:hypothetical protein
MTKRQKVRERMFNKIRQFEQSGLSKSDFCARHQISQSHLHYWLKIYQSATLVQEPEPSFIPVVIDDIISVNDNDRIIVTGQGGLQVSFPAQAASIPLIRQLLEG